MILLESMRQKNGFLSNFEIVQFRNSKSKVYRLPDNSMLSIFSNMLPTICPPANYKLKGINDKNNIMRPIFCGANHAVFSNKTILTKNKY